MTANKMNMDILSDMVANGMQVEADGGKRWMTPWLPDANGGHRNAKSGRFYKGVNILILGFACAASGYSSVHWQTLKGWRSKGHKLAEGEQFNYTQVVFWARGSYEDKETGEKKFYTRPKFYNVFNADQLDPATPFFPKERAKVTEFDAHAAAEKIIVESDIKLVHGGNRACFIPSQNVTNVPNKIQFKSAAGYYGTVFHEFGHATGHKSRLDRVLTGRFGSPEYSFEELIAELTSVIVCITTGVVHEPTPDHSRYLNSWIKGVRDNPKAISMAFVKAQAAADYIQGVRYDD